MPDPQEELKRRLGTVPTLELHHLCLIMPEHSEAQFAELKEDIKANKLRIPVVIFQDKILDGRGRYKTCKELWEQDRINPGFESQQFQGTEKEASAYVVSANVKRRHLTESQRSLIAAQLANGGRGGDRSKPSIGGLTQAEAATLLNVGEKSVERAKSVLGGNPGLADAVRSGKIKVSAADKFAKSDKQDELLAKHNNDLVKAVEEANAKPEPTLWETWKKKLEAIEIEKIEGTINDLITRLQAYLKARKEEHEVEQRKSAA
jgi:hypothetical protein